MLPDIRRRIVNAKYVLERAAGIQAESNEMSISISLLLIHDAIELLMLAVLDHRNIKAKERREFMDFWTDIKQAGLPVPPDDIPMRSLNKLRVGLKHHGNLPNSQTVRDLLPRARGFFENVLKSYCDLDYEDVSLIDLIADEEVREILKVARQKFIEGDKTTAMTDLKVAFHKIEHPGGKGLPKLHAPRKPSLPSQIDREVGPYLEQLHDFLDRCATRTNLLTIGVDLRRYADFTRSGPALLWSVTGKYQAQHSVMGYEHVSSEKFDGFIAFLIDYALKVSERLLL